jgi:hypothetical protein
MDLVIFVAAVVVMAGIAAKKGFNPLLWVLAGGVPGLAVLLLMPSANAFAIDNATILARRKRGNIAGAVISLLAILLAAIIFVAS